MEMDIDFWEYNRDLVFNINFLHMGEYYRLTHVHPSELLIDFPLLKLSTKYRYIYRKDFRYSHIKLNIIYNRCDDDYFVEIYSPIISGNKNQFFIRMTLREYYELLYGVSNYLNKFFQNLLSIMKVNNEHIRLSLDFLCQKYLEMCNNNMYIIKNLYPNIENKTSYRSSEKLIGEIYQVDIEIILGMQKTYSRFENRKKLDNFFIKFYFNNKSQNNVDLLEIKFDDNSKFTIHGPHFFHNFDISYFYFLNLIHSYYHKEKEVIVAGNESNFIKYYFSLPEILSISTFNEFFDDNKGNYIHNKDNICKPLLINRYFKEISLMKDDINKLNHSI